MSLKLSFFRKLLKSKTLISLSVGLFLFVFFVGTYFLYRPLKSPEQFQVQQLANVARLYLTGPTSVHLGDSFAVDLYLNTNGADVDAVDAVVDFDTNLAHLREANETPAGIEVFTTNFKTFAPIIDEEGGEFDVQRVVDCANTGSHSGLDPNVICIRNKIEFGAVTFDFATNDITNPVNDNGIRIARLNFTAMNAGTLNLNFDFSLDSTTDSNVIAHDDQLLDDILAETVGISVIIDDGTTSSPSPSPIGCPGDVDGNGQINFTDFMLVVRNYGQSGYDFATFIYIVRTYGSSCH